MRVEHRICNTICGTPVQAIWDHQDLTELGPIHTLCVNFLRFEMVRSKKSLPLRICICPFWRQAAALMIIFPLPGQYPPLYGFGGLDGFAVKPGDPDYGGLKVAKAADPG